MSDQVEAPSLKAQLESVQTQYDRHAHRIGHLQRVMKQLQKDMEESLDILLSLNQESIALQDKIAQEKKDLEAKKAAEELTV